MFCGACGQENPTGHKFCGGCGKPLQSGTERPHQNGHYSVILQSIPQDEFERFRVIKQLAVTLKLSEPEARAKVGSSRWVIVSVGSLREAEELQRVLEPLGVAVSMRPSGGDAAARVEGHGTPAKRPIDIDTLDLNLFAHGRRTELVKCRGCENEIDRTARTCPHCGERLIKCPACGGMSIAVGQRGFSLSSAAAGWMLVGPLGLLLGAAGRKQIEWLCQQCGNKWNPGG